MTFKRGEVSSGIDWLSRLCAVLLALLLVPLLLGGHFVLLSFDLGLLLDRLLGIHQLQIVGVDI